MSEIGLRAGLLSSSLQNIGRGFANGTRLTISDYNSSLPSALNPFDVLAQANNTLDAYHEILSSEMTNCIRLTQTFVAQDNVIQGMISDAVSPSGQNISISIIQGGA